MPGDTKPSPEPILIIIREAFAWGQFHRKLLWYENIFDMSLKMANFNISNIAIWHLTHWGRATHICVGELTIIGSDNGLSPARCQAIIWTNAGKLLIRPWGTNFGENFIGNQIFSFKKMHLKMSSAKWRLVYRGLNVLIMITKSIHLHSYIASFSYYWSQINVDKMGFILARHWHDMSAGIQSAEDSSPDTLGSNLSFGRGRQLFSNVAPPALGTTMPS